MDMKNDPCSKAIKKAAKKLIQKKEDMKKPFEKLLALYGLSEIKGSKHEPQILAMFKDAGFPRIDDDETAWCAAAMNWALSQADYRTTGKLTARSFLNSSATDPISRPFLGCGVVFWRGEKNGWQGHVGFYIREDENYIWTLGGNQSNEVNITRYPKSKLLGFVAFVKEGGLQPSILADDIDFQEAKMDSLQRAYDVIISGVEILENKFAIKER